MVKNSEQDSSTKAQPAAKAQKSSSFFRNLTELLILAALVGGGWYLYQNPQLLDVKTSPKASDPQVTQLQNKISALENKLALLEAESAGKISGRELTALNERIDAHTRLNREVLDSKASNNSILGLVNRLDMLEIKVNNLGRISNNGALILTAAMLVKDGAQNKRNFEYEAEVLRQLADGTNMQRAAEQIALYAKTGIEDENQLIAEFNQLYAQTAANEALKKEQVAQVPEETTADWKNKITEKLSTLVTIKYGQQQPEETAQSVVVHDEVYTLVNDGFLEKAVSSMVQDPKYQTDQYKKWQEKVSRKMSFDKILHRIQALTLAVMKSENLQNQAQ